MAKDELVGNMATENLASWFEINGVPLNLDKTAFAAALRLSETVFTS
jgi:hydroxymethylglutaryl-CoA lyase